MVKRMTHATVKKIMDVRVRESLEQVTVAETWHVLDHHKCKTHIFLTYIYDGMPSGMYPCGTQGVQQMT
jgi:Zn/Cd-binding protein ZinT